MTESDYSKQINDERVKNFLEEFKTLLSKYRVEIELEEKCSGYYGSDYTINICFDGYCDGEEYVHYRDLNIGSGTILNSDGSVRI